MITREGEAPVILATSRDVTDRKRAEEELRRLAAIVESSEDAICSRSLDGIVLTWNPGAERLYGYRAEEILGRPMSVLMPPDRVTDGLIPATSVTCRVIFAHPTHDRRRRGFGLPPPARNTSSANRSKAKSPSCSTTWSPPAAPSPAPR